MTKVRLFFTPIFLFLISANTVAKSLFIGLPLNMSGTNAQYSLEFKNGIEAYLQMINGSDQLGKFDLKLISMDDLATKERAISNTNRLIKSKKVLAILTNHQRALSEQIANVALKNKTLLLSANHINIPTNKRNRKYIINYEPNIEDQIATLSTDLKRSENVFVLSSNNFNEKEITFAINKLKKENSIGNVTQLTSESLLTINIEKPSTFIINKDFIPAINDIKFILNQSIKHHIIVMSNTGSQFIANALMFDNSTEQLSQISYLSTTPLHLTETDLVQQFNSDMNNFNPNLNKSDQAFKGYLLAKILSHSINKSMEGVKADSIMGVVTLPFQILDKMVGWVKHSGADINSRIIADKIKNQSKLNIGLSKSINISRDNIVINDAWLLKTNKDGNFIKK